MRAIIVPKKRAVAGPMILDESSANRKLAGNGLVGRCERIVGNLETNNRIGNIAGKFKTVGDFVAVKASNNRRVQQLSTSGVQQIQHQSLKNNSFQQSSTGL